MIADGKTWGNSSGGVTSTGQQGNFWFGQPLATEHQIDETAADVTFYYYNGTAMCTTYVSPNGFTKHARWE